MHQKLSGEDKNFDLFSQKKNENVQQQG
jgi:hypothetical protein